MVGAKVRRINTSILKKMVALQHIAILIVAGSVFISLLMICTMISLAAYIRSFVCTSSQLINQSN
jgi:hypothetical protein